MKAFYHGLIHATLLQICKADVASVVGFIKIVFEMPECKFIDRKKRRTLSLAFALLVGHLMLFDFNIIFPGEIAQSLLIRHLLMLHYKVHRTSALAATETFADIL